MLFVFIVLFFKLYVKVNLGKFYIFFYNEIFKYKRKMEESVISIYIIDIENR